MASEILKLIFRGQDETSKAVKSLRGNLNTADKAIGNVKKSLGGMKTAIGAAAGVAGFGLLAKKALQSADELGKVSQRLGVAASDLSALQLAASYSGVEVGTFNKLMEIFQKRVGEAAEGTGIAKDALQKFGIDAEKLAKLPLDQQLAVIADEFKNLKTPAERAAAASDLFSNRGIKMLNFLDLGSDGLSDLRAEFKATGLEIEDSAIDQIESFNDSMTKVSAIINQALIKGLADAAPEMERFAQKAAEMAAPLVGDLLRGLTFILDNMGTITKLIGAFLAMMVVQRVIAFGAALFGLVKALAAVRIGAIATQAAMGPIGLAMAAISAAAVYFADDIADAADAVSDFIDPTEDATDGTDEMAEALEALEAITRDVERPLENHADVVDDVAQESQAAAVETDEFAEALKKLKAASVTSNDEIDDFIAQMEEYQDTVDNTTATQEDYNAALKKTITDLTGVKFEADELRGEIDKVKATIVLATEAFGENSIEVKELETRLENLGGELVEAIQKTSSFTAEQRELLDEITANETALADLQTELENLDVLLGKNAITQGQYNTKVAETTKEINDLKNEMAGVSDATGTAFGTESIQGFFDAIASGSSPGGALSGLIGELIGSGGVQDAIAGCFGVTPVTDFGEAVRNLFTGDGSALGAFGVALGGLTTALGNFFAGGELKFSAFKDAIIATLSEIAAAAVASVGINFLKNLIPGLATGGRVEGYAVGGRVTGAGGPKEDKVLARLSPGEYVINAATVSKMGTSFFDAINSNNFEQLLAGGMFPKFSLGGAVTGFISRFLSGPFAFTTSAGYDIDNADFGTYLFDLFEALSQTDPRDDPLEAYDTAMEIIVSKLAKAISDAAAMIGNTFGTDILSGGKVGDIITGVLSPLGGLSTQDFLNEFDVLYEDSTFNGLRDSVFDYLFGKISPISAAPIDFNMDDVVAALFGSAQGVAGGNLTLTQRETGGPLERGQASIVGESGPELFVPGRGGTVSPIGRDGGKELIRAVQDVRDEVAQLRRQVGRSSGAQLAGGRA